jgi:ADP-heptose:LPS heptosyltransferase
LAARMACHHDVRFVITGSAGERPLAARIAPLLDGAALDLCGRLSLGQLYALYRRCALWIGNDTGPMHFATAAEIPVVVMWGAASPHKFGPLSGRCLIITRSADANAAASPDHIAGISVEHAWSRLRPFVAAEARLLAAAAPA